MTFDKYKDEEGYTDTEGVFFPDAESWLQSRVLDFCGCGPIEENLIYVRDGLKLLDERRALVYEDQRTWEEQLKLEASFFGNKQASEFFFYVMSMRDLTEHGGSIPGWLTEEGENFIKDVDELYALPT